MTEIFAPSPIRLVESGLPGENFAAVARRTGAYGILPTDTDLEVLIKLASYLIENNSGLMGPPGSPGEGYPSRAALALAGNDAIDLYDAYLTEPGYEGKFVFSTADLSAEVGADPDRRFYVAAQSDPTGASGAWVREASSAQSFINTGAGAVLRPVQAVLRDLPLNPRDFGAIGDGFYHPLSERFSTLAEAQAVYPFVEETDDLGNDWSEQSLDWAGIQAALNEAARDVNRRGVVRLPVGRFIPSNSLKIASHVTFEGGSSHGCVLQNQSVPLAAPQMVNRDPDSFVFVNIRNIISIGGTHTLKIDIETGGETSGLVIERVSTALQTIAQVEANLLQTTAFRDCNFSDGQYGIKSTGPTCNAVIIDNVRFGNHSESDIYARGANLLSMVGGSMEASGAAGKYTIDIEDGHAVSFRQIYLEARHEYLLRARNCESILFDCCTVMGASIDGGPLQAFKFDVDSSLISFSGNYWAHQTNGPLNMLVSGDNQGLGGNSNIWSYKSQHSARFNSRYVPVNSGAMFDIVEFTRTATLPDNDSNQQLLSGKLWLQFTGYDLAGTRRTISQFYNIKADAAGQGNIVVTQPDLTDELSNPGAIAVTIQPKAGANTLAARIEVAFSNVSTSLTSAVRWGVEYDNLTTIGANALQAAPV